MPIDCLLESNQLRALTIARAMGWETTRKGDGVHVVLPDDWADLVARSVHKRMRVTPEFQVGIRRASERKEQ
ncbi:MAG: hypothetical protein JSV65_05060 [Armatimonadota bacterium]|nr:MAG: hypothetical protein JSV65_05060 [Armatimonadota bacterium]